MSRAVVFVDAKLENRGQFSGVEIVKESCLDFVYIQQKKIYELLQQSYME